MLMHSAGDPSYQNLSQEANLKKLFEAYNGFKANVAISKWQLSEDFMAGIINVIVGMSDESRQIVRGHLDFNKWEHSAYNESLLKSKRHTIGNTPRGLDQHFASLLTVTSESQAWFFKRYNSYFATSAKKQSRLCDHVSGGTSPIGTNTWITHKLPTPQRKRPRLTPGTFPQWPISLGDAMINTCTLPCLFPLCAMFVL
ncbi:unnamed protein product [Polarella glacialis]|uniref:Uncharacterized protein n=1 Tax=Polarella glacialis TaxID=89957 RepID=A0A813FQ67_POLGL|nr:unnamed protein product [Polarella glacialis]